MVSFHVGTSVEADCTVRKQRGRPRLKPLPEVSLYALLVYRITDAPLSQGCGNELWMVRQLRTIGQANVTGWAG